MRVPYRQGVWALTLLLGFFAACKKKPTVLTHVLTHAPISLPSVDIADPAIFLENLSISPYWKVEKTPEGQFTATARGIHLRLPDRPKVGAFLFEAFSDEGKAPPRRYELHNGGYEGEGEVGRFWARIIFKNPDTDKVDLLRPQEDVSLRIVNVGQDYIGPGSISTLAIRLGGISPIYLLVGEMGTDKERLETFRKIPLLMEEINRLARLPRHYSTLHQYSHFYRSIFGEKYKAYRVRRAPGIQGRDTFYGYFRYDPNFTYDGINIRISNPTYCNGECTRKKDRLAKAEYSGKAHFPGNPLFFLLDENTVYIGEEHLADYGWETGKKKFSADIDILNAQGHALYEGRGLFTGSKN